MTKKDDKELAVQLYLHHFANGRNAKVEEMTKKGHQKFCQMKLKFEILSQRLNRPKVVRNFKEMTHFLEVRVRNFSLSVQF